MSRETSFDFTASRGFSDSEIDFRLVKYGVHYDPPALVIFYTPYSSARNRNNGTTASKLSPLESSSPSTSPGRDSGNAEGTTDVGKEEKEKIRKRKMPVRDFDKDSDIQLTAEALKKKHATHLKMMSNYKLEKLLTLIQG